MSRTDSPSGANLNEQARKLELETSLRKLANRIHSSSLDQILLESRADIQRLVKADRVTVFVKDTLKNEIFSMYKDGVEVREIRVPVGPTSIAGFVAQTGTIVRVADAYVPEQLQHIHPSLHFDDTWDKRTGYRTRSLLVVPVQLPDRIHGVIMAINKEGGAAFSEHDERIAHEIAESLAVAINNQKRMAARRSKFDHLFMKELLTDDRLEEAQRLAHQDGTSVELVLHAKFGISREEIGQSLSQFTRCPFLAFVEGTPVPSALIEQFSVDYAKHRGVVPLGEEDGRVIVLMEDPKDVVVRDDLKSRFPGKRIDVKVGIREDILAYVDLFYGLKKAGEGKPEPTKEQLQETIAQLDQEIAPEVKKKEEEGEVLEDDSGLVRLVNQIIEQGYVQGASDIHIEPYPEKDLEVRFRIDGVCQRFTTIPKRYSRALTSRIKIMCGLDIAERRLPQDGKIKFRNFGQYDIELRVAVIPSTAGQEDVVMRILASSKPIPLDDIGMIPRNLDLFKKLVVSPYGIVLCVGPTGSGKTTTLHSALGFINQPDTKIWTAEDPVEITQAGLRQVQVQAKIGYTFERALRAFLRGDPDVIMVGEMRDLETASAAIEASLTGHMVFSTLHTNSAPETVTRLLDLGLDPYSFGDSLLGILAQRLVRTLCKSCRESYVPQESDLKILEEEFGAPEPWMPLGVKRAEARLWKTRTCDKCKNSGYKGRMGLHELLVVDDEMRKLIYRKAKVAEMRDLAIAQGMLTLKQDGVWKILRGSTDLREVRSVCMR